jgi:hypothetical protein
MNRYFVLLILVITGLVGNGQQLTVDSQAHPSWFALATKNTISTIYADPADHKVVHLAAAALRDDLFDITGKKPGFPDSLSSYPIIIGTIGHSRLIDELVKSKKLRTDNIKGKWESFHIAVVQQPFKNVKQALVIAGSDRRGTAFGVFELSKWLGVSPWTWWADVSPEPRNAIYIQPGQISQGSPSVKYRGIFINDEDWGLQPWAAKNMDTDIQDIGPKTYAKVFELLLRLKANYLWPAMHPCTRAFYYYKDNPRVADEYAIVVGASHCEPMLRNNVFEWSENFEHEYHTKPGEWRYDRNGPQIYQYWKDRVIESKNYESVYTVGMRGIHDGSMPGPSSIDGKTELLQKIIADQRTILEAGFGNGSQTVPQIFCPYKEVLNVYRNGLQLPDDVTIVWADDNHGYVRQLSNQKEEQRKGRSGIYYHLSYWGAPQDYLWLSSISPSLIAYEMTKAYEYGADRLWIFNVGDIKPAEMEMEFAMDLAWNVKKWTPHNADQYAKYWAEKTFGKAFANEIAAIKKTYYQLAAEGKPEHLRAITYTREQQDERLAKYNRIADDAEKLKDRIPKRLKDAYFQLILYPVAGAKLMNEKIFYADKSLNPEGTIDSGLAFAEKSKEAFSTIQQLTQQYNEGISHGKWNGMMSWHPRDQAVFGLPKIATRAYLDSLHTRAFRTYVLEIAEPVVIPVNSIAAKKDVGNTRIELLKGLGIGGEGISIIPFKPTPGYGSNTVNSSYVEYEASVPAGTRTVAVKCLPTQSIDSDGKLQYAISVNGDSTQYINIHAESESRAWRQNVVQGFAEGKSTHSFKGGKARIRIYLSEPGVVINKITIQ